MKHSVIRPCLLCVAFYASMSLPSAATDALFRVKVEGKVGFINRQGAVAIEAAFSWANDFHERRAAVWSDGGVGFITPAGETAVPMRYADAMDFADGRGWVKEGRDWFLIDAQGGRIGGNSYSKVRRFAGGYAAVSVGEEWGYVGRDGKLSIPASFAMAGDFAEGLAPVRRGDLWAYIGEDGRFAISWRFKSGAPFNSGLARVRSAAKPSRVGYIDRTGRFVVTPVYDWGTEPAEGAVLAWGRADETRDEVSAYDLKGKRLWSIHGATGAYRFSEGLALVYAEGNGLVVDRSGAIVSTLKYDRIGPVVSEGRLAVMQRSSEGVQRWGFVGPSGKVAIPLVYDYVSPFKNGLALVHGGAGYYVSDSEKPGVWIEGGRWMYIDPDARVVWAAGSESGVSLKEVRFWFGHRDEPADDFPAGDAKTLRKVGRIPYAPGDLRPVGAFFAEHPPAPDAPAPPE